MKTPKVKICGVTDEAALAAALEHGADFVGFVFHDASPRNLSLSQAAALARQVPDSVLKVGLFVNPSDEALNATLAQVPLDMIQLHGDESPERLGAIKTRHALPTIKAIRIVSQEDLSQIALYEDSADWLLFDAGVKNQERFGGLGQRFDWSILEGRVVSKPWMLAGGLTPDNVLESLTRLSPDGLDVSSGVESAPGRKDPAKIAAFLRAAKRR